MRIGIIALLHESNTFISRTTSIERFHEDLYLIGESIATKLSASHHEIGGFFIGLEKYRGNLSLEAIPIVAFRATPSGPIATEAMEEMVATICEKQRSNCRSMVFWSLSMELLFRSHTPTPMAIG